MTIVITKPAYERDIPQYHSICPICKCAFTFHAPDFMQCTDDSGRIIRFFITCPEKKCLRRYGYDVNDN